MERRRLLSLFIFFYQPPYLPVGASPIDCGGGAGVVQWRPCPKHATDGAAGVEEVIFLHNHYCFPHMSLKKVNTEVVVCERLPPEALYWTLHRPIRSMEVDPIYPGLWGGGGPTKSPEPSHAGPGFVPPETPPPSLIHNLGTLPATSVSPGRKFPPPSSYLYNLPPIFCHTLNMDDRPPP